MIASITYFCGLASAVYVTTCLVCAAVRWFHMCRPYNRNPRYYYPGRPFLTAAWLSSLTLLPYLLYPDSPDAWYLTRFYFFPVVLYHFTLLLFSYFGTVMEWKKWQWPMMILGLPVGLVLLAAVVIAIWPGEQLDGILFPTIILYALGTLITFFCLFSMGVVWIWAKRFDPDDFSNPSDFPVTQARSWLVIIIVNLALCWTGALLNNPAVLAVIQILIAASCVVFVITALHPNRNRPVEDPASDTKAAKAAPAQKHRPLPKKKQAEILSAIRAVVEDQQAFLDPHLTLQDVAYRCGYSRTYISALVKEQLGGFANYVNHFRLDYVDNYLKTNPDATLGEAIDAAGFGSRPTYYHMKNRLRV